MPLRASDGSAGRFPIWTLGMPLFLLTVTLVLGTWGFFEFHQTIASRDELTGGTGPRLLDAFFFAAGLPILDTIAIGEFGAIPSQLDWARFFGVATFGYTAFLALALLCRELLKPPLIRSWRWRKGSRHRGHAVVCGMGWKSEAIVRDLLIRGWRVAVIDEDAASHRHSRRAGAGAIVLRGDSLDPDVLDRADVGRAGKVFIAGECDETNLRILKQMSSLHRSHRITECSVHVRDARTREIVHRSLAENRRLKINCFDTSEATARLLMGEFPFDGPPGRGGADIEVLIFGDGSMACALLLQTMLLGHFLDRRLRITIVAQHAERRREQCLRDFPCLRPGSFGDDPSVRRLLRDVLPRIEFVELPTSDTDLLDPAGTLLGRIGAGSISTLYLCLDDGMSSSAYAAALLPALERRATAVDATVQLFYYYNYPGDAHAAMVERNLRSLAPAIRVQTFADLVRGCAIDAVEGRPGDDLAREIAANFRRSWGGAEWHELSEADRLANRRAADHIGIKLRCIGADIVDRDLPGADLEFTDLEIEALAELEHRRWCAERLLSGWRPLPRTEENRALWRKDKSKLKLTKVHWDLVPFDELGEHDRDKDHMQVRHIPRLLRTVGLKAQRMSPPPLERHGAGGEAFLRPSAGVQASRPGSDAHG